MVFGIVLNRNGWRIDYLVMSTPVEELTRTVDARHPDLVVLAATLTGNLELLATQLTALARRAPLALAEAGCEAASYLVHSLSDADLSATMPAPPQRSAKRRRGSA
jgi:MerR family transcriptional regulator, light-induced transcriptional regulator